MKKILLLFLLGSSFLSYAQIDSTQVYQQPKFWDNVRFGGGLGLAFGNNQTTIAISPSAIYLFSNQFAAGPTLSYLYNKNFDLKSDVFGVGAVGLYNPTEFLQASAEFEHLFVNQRLVGFDDVNVDFSALYLGVAYRTGWAAFGVRYDVLYDERDAIFASPWSPIFRFYF